MHVTVPESLILANKKHFLMPLGLYVCSVLYMRNDLLDLFPCMKYVKHVEMTINLNLC